MTTEQIITPEEAYKLARAGRIDELEIRFPPDDYEWSTVGMIDFASITAEFRLKPKEPVKARVWDGWLDDRGNILNCKVVYDSKQIKVREIQPGEPTAREALDWVLKNCPMPSRSYEDVEAKRDSLPE